MEKEFIPYNLSLRLKQLGFDELCLAWYDSEYQDILNYDHTNNCCGWLNGNHCTVPTYSQAFRWFREKYGYIHHITYFSPSKAQIPGEADYQGFVLFPHQDIHKLPKSSYATYEEVEAACLEKLIEIVKLKQQAKTK